LGRQAPSQSFPNKFLGSANDVILQALVFFSLVHF